MPRVSRFFWIVAISLGAGILLGATFLRPHYGVSTSIVPGEETKLTSTVENAGSGPTSEGKVQVVRVIDGDTLQLENGERVRLIGIDATERGDCFSEEAANELMQIALGKTLRAERDISERDRYGRLLYYLYDGETFINRKLVEDGAARTFPYPPDTSYAAEFASAEQKAKADRRGVWGSCSGFDVSRSAVLDAKDTLGDCMIKGNISSSGEKIYHLPGCGSYKKTTITSSSGEHWFCSEAEAQTAGWRKAKNCP